MEPISKTPFYHHTRYAAHKRGYEKAQREYRERYKTHAKGFLTRKMYLAIRLGLKNLGLGNKEYRQFIRELHGSGAF